MSVLRQLNILGQMRLDVPHLRSIESSIAADFDVVAGRITAGQQALVVRGFQLANFSGGTAATSIQLATADSILLNVNASEAGTFLWVPATQPVDTLNPATNPNVVGSFTASQTNYIGLDLIRLADPTTSDLVQFLDPNTLLEDPKNIPLGRILNYQIVISTTPFSAQPNIVPIAKVVTDSQNNISLSTPVVDARSLLFRLGSGGDFPNAQAGFTWPQGRVEVDTGATSFQGGDKGITSQKDWNAAVMSRIWEIGGGENWYSPTADRNVHLSRLPGSVFADGDQFEFVGGNLHWKGLRVVFDNSNETGVYYNVISDQTTNVPGLTDLTPGQCLYVDLVRSSIATVQAFKGTIQTLGTPTIPGQRWILAWANPDGSISTRDSPFPVNTTIPPATTTSVGGVQLAYAAGLPATPLVYPLDANGTITSTPTGGNAAFVGTGAGAGNAFYATGGYTARGFFASGGAPGSTGGDFNGGAGSGASLPGVGLNASGGLGASTAGSTAGTGATISGGYGTNSGVNGGIGATVSGGDSFSFSAGTPTLGGDGLHVHGGNGSNQVTSSLQTAGTGIIVTVGFSGGLASTPGGTGITVTGGAGNNSSAVSPGGFGIDAYGGGFPFLTVGGNNGGVAVRGTGGKAADGSGFTPGNGGVGVWGIGGLGGGFIGIGGVGVYGIGGAGAYEGGGQGGTGVQGVAGNTTAVGGLFQGSGASTSPSITTNAGLVAVAGSGNSQGIETYGNGSGSGITGTGGATGLGALFTGGSSGASGVKGVGTGNFAGVIGLGTGATSTGDLHSTNGVIGGYFAGSNSGSGGDGVVALAQSNTGAARTGGFFTGSTAATGNNDGGAGVIANGGNASGSSNNNGGIGVTGKGGTATGTGNPGPSFYADTTNGPALRTNGRSGAAAFPPGGNPPAHPVNGDMYLDTSTHLNVWRTWYSTLGSSGDWTHSMYVVSGNGPGYAGNWILGYSPTTFPGSDLHYWVDNNQMLHMSGLSYLPAEALGGDKLVFTLPAGFRPQDVGGGGELRQFGVAYSANGSSTATNIGIATVNPSTGDVRFELGSASTSQPTQVWWDTVKFRVGAS